MQFYCPGSLFLSLLFPYPIRHSKCCITLPLTNSQFIFFVLVQMPNASTLSDNDNEGLIVWNWNNVINNKYRQHCTSLNQSQVEAICACGLLSVKSGINILWMFMYKQEWHCSINQGAFICHSSM